MERRSGFETWKAVEHEGGEDEDMDISKLTDEQLIELAGKMQAALGRQAAQDWGEEWEGSPGVGPRKTASSRATSTPTKQVVAFTTAGRRHDAQCMCRKAAI